jgi:hypothetical protein
VSFHYVLCVRHLQALSQPGGTQRPHRTFACTAATSAAYSKVHKNIAASAKRRQLKQVMQPRELKVQKQSK